MRLYPGKLVDNLLQLNANQRLGLLPQPSAHLPVDVHDAPLEDGPGVHPVHGTRQRAVPVAGDALHFHAHPAKVLEVFPHFPVVLLVRKTVALRVPRIAVAVQDEAQAVAEIGAVNHEVSALLRLDLEGRRPGETAPKQPLDTG